ncbi:transposase family protein [Streptomyces sp. NPDC047000]|uniref:transposase family protein n=1 Tax=Streptomyces sp. NPDC047000 TaxID=3155474 RepID=UPI0033EC9B36
MVPLLFATKAQSPSTSVQFANSSSGDHSCRTPAPSASITRSDRRRRRERGNGARPATRDLLCGRCLSWDSRAGKADRRNYSGKHQRHGLHSLALTDERGRLIWMSAARPGRTHDNTAARQDHVLAHLRTANRVLAVGRAPVEHSFAHLENWRILTKLRTDPARAAQLLRALLLRALLILTNLEVTR